MVIIVLNSKTQQETVNKKTYSANTTEVIDKRLKGRPVSLCVINLSRRVSSEREIS